MGNSLTFEMLSSELIFIPERLGKAAVVLIQGILPARDDSEEPNADCGFFDRLYSLLTLRFLSWREFSAKINQLFSLR